MKIKTFLYSFLLTGTLFILVESCKKDSAGTSGASNSIVDIDGNVYHSVKIGSQVWMVENLKTTKYRNGDLVINVPDQPAWELLSSGAYCLPANDAANYKATYGLLYNWFAAVDSRNIAPQGWHVPSNDEWTVLITFLGNDTLVAGKIKEAGIKHWPSPNAGTTNVTGFTALPGGFRRDGPVITIGQQGGWLSTTEQNNLDCLLIAMDALNIVRRGEDSKTNGLSIRCVKD